MHRTAKRGDPCAVLDVRDAAAVRSALPPRGFDPTPAALVVDSRFQLGTFATAVPRINPLDAMPAATRWLHALRLKEWQAFQAMDADYFIVGAIYMTKVVDLLQIAVVEKRSAHMRKWQFRVPPRRLRIAQGLERTTSTGRAGGLRVTFRNDIPRGDLRIEAQSPSRADLPALALRVAGRCAAGQAGHVVALDDEDSVGAECLLQPLHALHGSRAQRDLPIVHQHGGALPAAAITKFPR
jgi:hypothetical protein